MRVVFVRADNAKVVRKSRVVNLCESGPCKWSMREWSICVEAVRVRAVRESGLCESGPWSLCESGPCNSSPCKIRVVHETAVNMLSAIRPGTLFYSVGMRREPYWIHTGPLSNIIR